MADIMKILIITPYYHPYINPRAHRWTSIAIHWAKQGHEIHIICSKNPNHPKFEILKEVKVHRTGYNSLKEILYHIFRNKNKRGIVEKDKKQKSRGGAAMQWINDKFLKKIYFPDDAFMWYFPARKLAKELNEKFNFDCVISSSVPFTSHLVGLYVKKNNPDLKWIADTGDPFAFQPLHPMNNYFLYGKWNKQLERRVAETSTAITLTNEGATKMYSAIFPNQKKKFITIPPLFKDEGIEENHDSRSTNIENVVNIGYFGSFFKKIREPKSVLQFFSLLLIKYPKFRTKLRIHFYGNIFENFLKDFEKFDDLKDCLIFHGLVSRGEVKAEMKKMDFLFNIGNATDFQLASKSVDYMASGKPIINFCGIENDTFAEFFKDYPFILNVDLNKKEYELKTVKSFLEEKGGERLGKESKKKLMKDYLVENVAAKYIELLNPS